MIVAWLLCLVVEPPIVNETCDVIEVNHFFDSQGALVFEQVIFWDWHGDDMYHVADWRLLKAPEQLPYRAGREWRAVWNDGDMLRRELTKP